MFRVKIKKNDQDKYVYQFWCKICAANKDKIYHHQALNGVTKTTAKRFINGTNFVTKLYVSYFLCFFFKSFMSVILH